jgi:hypothetical protein
MIMGRYVKWRNCSFPMRKDRWMPEATVDVIDGDKGIHCNVLVQERDFEKLKQGEIVFSTPEAAKEAARRMVAKLIREKWGIPEEMLQNW